MQNNRWNCTINKSICIFLSLCKFVTKTLVYEQVLCVWPMNVSITCSEFVKPSRNVGSSASIKCHACDCTLLYYAWNGTEMVKYTVYSSLSRTHTRDKALSTHHDNKEATADSRGGVKSLIESPNIIFHYSSSLPSPEGSSLRKFNDSIYYFEVMFWCL